MKKPTPLEDARKKLKAFQEYRDQQESGKQTDSVSSHPYSFQAKTATATLDDVILSATTRIQLDEGIAKLRFHKKIYDEWNFGSVDKQGLSTVYSLEGSTGVGKTLTAEAFAGTIGLPIIKVGIAELESKFMGETSKNIQDLFQAASKAKALLFLDEADTLLGKRLSSVTQGIDNEVNAMRSTLLMEIEKFDGVVVFATNFPKNYDEAFRSRISHRIYFDLPDLQARKQLWSKMLVEQIPLLESREEFINLAAELSEGFSGRDIRTCMRLVLPKALLEAEQAGEEPMVKLEQLKEIIHRVNHAKTEVANEVGSLSSSDIRSAKSLLGINN